MPVNRSAALEAAIDLGHDFLGCEHLVLGLAEQADSTGGELLRDFGITPERIRRAIPTAVAAAALGYTHAVKCLRPQSRPQSRTASMTSPAAWISLRSA